MKKRKEVKTTFIAGTEWLYYKIYCGNSTADDILINLINPLACKLINTQIISLWFFIHYYDPEFHLRIRFNINQKEYFAEVISELENIITSYFDKSLIWDIQINTYVKEIERYGIETITDVEKIFFYDSKLISQTLKILKENNLRVMFAIKIVEVILNELQFSID
jgi:thiopeptide-type bacteriocin biosynthesis protein|tara:strand:+ start:684 stop:1178 length:495 start_codon:yes stop_codon:yes gene_type:complete